MLTVHRGWVILGRKIWDRAIVCTDSELSRRRGRMSTRDGSVDGHDDQREWRGESH
ncbi:hypothetical protein PILCRDRAFT_820230 [Piloderma croceum F 1598]|uniref:Uncharacterized protein n=1 Tax=Piloderma croceum (strain F 1598) TaxID=765440 RepID=A0A0C3FRM0_PILCF|nr:hypothetical protein PILCRDRAFT_820230 [Piloderma croceum F 1598]